MFGERLKLARKMAGYSLRGLAGAFGGEVTAQAIGKYERGEMMPSSGVLLHMARVLGGLPTPCISPESRPAGRWWGVDVSSTPRTTFVSNKTLTGTSARGAADNRPQWQWRLSSRFHDPPWERVPTAGSRRRRGGAGSLRSWRGCPGSRIILTLLHWPTGTHL